MNNNPIIKEFIEFWNKGGRSKLSGTEIAVIAVFYDWLKEREAHPPDLGISVSESIGIRDKPS